MTGLAAVGNPQSIAQEIAHLFLCITKNSTSVALRLSILSHYFFYTEPKMLNG